MIYEDLGKIGRMQTVQEDLSRLAKSSDSKKWLIKFNPDKST